MLRLATDERCSETMSSMREATIRDLIDLADVLDLRDEVTERALQEARR